MKRKASQPSQFGSRAKQLSRKWRSDSSLEVGRTPGKSAERVPLLSKSRTLSGSFLPTDRNTSYNNRMHIMHSIDQILLYKYCMKSTHMTSKPSIRFANHNEDRYIFILVGRVYMQNCNCIFFSKGTTERQCIYYVGCFNNLANVSMIINFMDLGMIILYMIK